MDGNGFTFILVYGQHIEYMRVHFYNPGHSRVLRILIQLSRFFSFLSVLLHQRPNNFLWLSLLFCNLLESCTAQLEQNDQAPHIQLLK
jgi:hypothetical protein